MVRTVKMNYPSDPKNSHELWKCPHCDFIDSQRHIILTCPAYQHLRVNKFFEKDHDLVQFFQEVLKMREATDSKLDKAKGVPKPIAANQDKAKGVPKPISANQDKAKGVPKPIDEKHDNAKGVP